MEIIKNRDIDITKKCVCYTCESEILVKKSDLDGNYVFECPICNSPNLWITETDKEIMNDIEKKEKELIDDLKDIIPRRYHDVMERIISTHMISLRRTIVIKNINKEDQ